MGLLSRQDTGNRAESWDNDACLIAELEMLHEEIDRVRAIAEDLHAYIVSNADISLSVAEKQMDWVDASE